MRNSIKNNNNKLNLTKCLIVCYKYTYICTIKIFTVYSTYFLFTESYLTKDNTPSRLTSVAHLGGFLFFKASKI